MTRATWPLLFVLVAVVTFGSFNVVSAHDGEPHLPLQGDGEQEQPDDTHRNTDEAPTLEEEAELIERAEREGIGQNPDFSASREPAGNEHLVGEWGNVENWPVIGVFVSLMYDGRVLAYDSIGDEPTEDYLNHTYTRATVYDPINNSHTDVQLDTGYNIFCSGFASLPDGDVFIAGGNADQFLNGIVQTHTFNPFDESWTIGPPMNYARWYPAVTPLPNGEMLITGGGFATSEVRETDGQIRQLTSGSQNYWNNRDYPWLQTAPDGRVAFIGPNNQLGYVTTSGTGAWQSTTQRDSFYRGYGSYVMYDVGKVLVAGGGSGSTNQRSAVIIDLDTDTVANTGDMANRRRQHDLTVLADGTVLATGGFASNAGLVDLNNSVFAAELWDPATGQWTTLASEARARQYHSTALLLPDGRVMSAGGGICGACQANGYIQKNAQFFSPPYLFKSDGSGQLADRPSITAAPNAINYDNPFTVQSPQANDIQKVAFVRNGSVTHSQNMEQRYMPLSFTVQNGALQIDAPANANIAPPGYYMLFLIDSAGVPSVAEMVNIQETNNQPPAADFTATPTSGSTPLTVNFDATASFDNDGTITSYAWDFGDGATGNGSTISHEYTMVGVFSAELTLTDDDGDTSTHSVTINVSDSPFSCLPGLLMETWTGIDGVQVADLTSHPTYPNNPTSSEIIATFESQSYIGDSYGLRVRGYIVPPETGSYTFWIASDDNSELWLSSDENPVNIGRIAYNNGWTWPREWDKSPMQQSNPINLVAGQPYYVEALMKEWSGGDNLGVAWQTPSAARDVIGNDYLCAYGVPSALPTADFSANPTSGERPLAVTFDATTSTDDGTIVSYDWAFGDGNIASGSTVNNTYVSSGIFDVTLTVTDNDGQTDNTTAQIVVTQSSTNCEESGVRYERWEGIPGTTVADLTSDPDYPDNPTVTQLLGDFEGPTNIIDNYGVRVSGYVVPPVTGAYTFWIASDDQGELWLSNNENPATASLIASVPAWAPPRQWDWYPEQQSAAINLIAGQRYYIEALMKEYGGGDNLAVAWHPPNGQRQVIPSVVLCQPIVDNNASPIASFSANPTSGDAPLTVTFDGSGSTDDGSIVDYAWEFGDGNNANGVTTSHTYANAGVYTARLIVTDDEGKTGFVTTTISVTQSGGNPSCNTTGVLREVWDNIWNGSVAALTSDPRYPANPSSHAFLADFVAPTNPGIGYGARMRAYLVAPETGAYTFWVASSNEGQLWLSTDQNAGNSSQIAQTSWSPEQGWDFTSGQQSAEINLVAGEYYYIEGLHYGSWGDTYFAVAWDTPSGSRELIPQADLCAYETVGTRAKPNSEILSTQAPLLIQSAVAQSFPSTLYDDLFVVLMADQPLREELLALGEQTVDLLADNDVVSADYIATTKALYTRLYDQASPDLQAWLASHYERITLSSLEGERAADAWASVNNVTVPTSVHLTHSKAYSLYSLWLVLAILSSLTLWTWLRRVK